MFFLKRKQTLKAVAAGKIISLQDVEDEVFSSNLLGDGFAITNHDGFIYSPIEGIVKSIFPTKHAITIATKQGVVLLIHMGLDTVELNGKPFSIKVNQGQHVLPTTLLASMNLKMLNEVQKNATVVVVLPDGPKGQLLKLNQQVTTKEMVFRF